MRKLTATLTGAFFLGACASSPGLVAAERGDRAALAAYVVPLEARGQVTDGMVAALAQATLEHELRTASAPDFERRVEDARPCTRSVLRALEERARVHDSAGAAAALTLLEAESLSQGRARGWLSDPDGGWRAVGARALVREEDGPDRRRAFVDPSLRVRVSAMRAAAVADDAFDVPGLLEAARLDPEPLARSAAVRAIAQIHAVPADIVQRLADVSPASDATLREDIAFAYAVPAIAEKGGAAALRTLVAEGHGTGALAAAGATLRARWGRGDPEARASALSLVVRSIDRGSFSLRAFALALAPLDQREVLEAVRRASDTGSDRQLRVGALARLLESTEDRSNALAALVSLAQPGGRAEVLRSARAALASAHDTSIQAWLEQDFQSDAAGKILAADALVAMRRSGRVAPLLADDDARTRSRVACAVLGPRSR